MSRTHAGRHADVSDPTQLYTLLDFDSDALGVRVARAEGEQSEARLAATKRAAAADGISLLTLSLPTGSSLAPQLRGYRVATKIVYEGSVDTALRLLRPIVPTDVLVTERPRGGDPSSRLLELAVETGKLTRFFLDPRISREQYRKVYFQWMRNSCNHTAADVVLVARKAGSDEVAGYVTVLQEGTVAPIPLLAVHSSFRRQGIASALFLAAFEWMAARGIRTGRSFTHATNNNTIGLNEKSGLKAVAEIDDYQVWLTARSAL